MIYNVVLVSAAHLNESYICVYTHISTHFRSLGGEDPLEKGMAPTPVFLPGEFQGQRSLVGYSPWGCRELDTTEGPTLSPFYGNIRYILFLSFLKIFFGHITQHMGS